MKNTSTFNCLFKKSLSLINVLLIFVLCFMRSEVSDAAFANYNNIIVGDRASGLGGSGVALLGDVSSAAFYNPSTMAFLEGNSFSAAAGIYKKFDTIFGDKEEFTQAATRLNLGFFRSLPASTGSVITWNDYKLGMSIVVPDYDTFRGDVSNTSTNISTLNMVDESLWVGGAISKKIDESSSWGLTIYYTARNYSRSINDRSFPSTNNAQIFYSEKTVKENALVPVVGYYTRLTPTWALGVSARVSSLQIGSEGSYFESYTDTTGPTVSSVNKETISGSFRIPSKLSAGLSWDPTNEINVSGTVDLYEGFQYRDLNDDLAGQVIDLRRTFNGAIGIEYKWYDWLRIRAGGFTNFSSHTDPAAGLDRVMDEKVDQIGFSTNVVLITKEKISYTFGGYYTGGRGRTVQRVNHTATIMPKTYQVFTMLVGTSISL